MTRPLRQRSTLSALRNSRSSTATSARPAPKGRLCHMRLPRGARQLCRRSTLARHWSELFREAALGAWRTAPERRRRMYSAEAQVVAELVTEVEQRKTRHGLTEAAPACH